MFEWLKELAARLRRSQPPLAVRLRRWQPPASGPLDDPDCGGREPRRSRPGGRDSAVAVEEPDPQRDVRAVGRSSQRWRG